MRGLSTIEIEAIAGGGPGDWSSCYHSGDNAGTPTYTCQDYTQQGQPIGNPYPDILPLGNFGARS